MESLKALNYTTSLDLLKQAEQLLLSAKVPQDIKEPQKSQLLALTYNNLGCFYKKHKKAIFYAQNCLYKSEQILQKLQSMNLFATPPDSGSEASQQTQRQAYIKNIHTMMAVALYNLGVEHEYLNEYKQAIESFNRAQYITQEILDKDPHLSKMINQGLQSVMMKQQKKYIITNIYSGGRNYSNSPVRMMIDMNSTRFTPIESMKSQEKYEKKPKNLTRYELMTQQSSYSSGKAQAQASMKEQVEFAYGGNHENSQQRSGNKSSIRRMAPNQGKIIYNQAERKAISNVRNTQQNKSPFKQIDTGIKDRELIRRGGGKFYVNNPALNEKKPSYFNKSNQKFSLPNIVSNNASHLYNAKQSTGSYQESDGQSYNSQKQMSQSVIMNQKAKEHVNFLSNSNSRKYSRQPQKISPMSSQQQRAIHNNSAFNPQRNLNKSQKQSNLPKFEPDKTNFTFGRSQKHQRIANQNPQVTTYFNDDQRMQQTISNISLKLGDLQSKLQNYKIENSDMIVEAENEVSYRNGSTHRTVKRNEGLKEQDLIQKSISFDQLSYVSSER